MRPTTLVRTYVHGRTFTTLVDKTLASKLAMRLRGESYTVI